jgi:ornithine decarboxylase
LTGPAIPTTLYGATCDGSDIICKEVQLPELEIGDWIAFPHMGAYTVVLATGFNGMNFDAIERRYIGLIPPNQEC